MAAASARACFSGLPQSRASMVASSSACSARRRRQPLQTATALRGVQLAPRTFERASCGSYRTVDIAGVAARDVLEDLAVRRIDDVDDGLRRRHERVAVDEVRTHGDSLAKAEDDVSTVGRRPVARRPIAILDASPSPSATDRR